MFADGSPVLTCGVVLRRNAGEDQCTEQQYSTLKSVDTGTAVPSYLVGYARSGSTA